MIGPEYVREGNGPFQQVAILALEPPVFFLHRSHRLVVEHDILKESFDLWNEERKIRDARCLDEIALETAVTVRGELFRVHAYLERHRAFPD